MFVALDFPSALQMTFGENRNWYMCMCATASASAAAATASVEPDAKRKKGKDYGLHDDDIDDSNTLIMLDVEMRGEKKCGIDDDDDNGRLYRA